MSTPSVSPLPIVLTIAGYDPSCGAGVTADLKTIAAHNCYGIACVTAITIQNTQEIRSIRPVEADCLRGQLRTLLEDMTVGAVKIGMLESEANVKSVVDLLSEFQTPNIVLDPLLRSSSGASLLQPNALPTLLKKLLPMASCITPNIAEAEALSGLKVETLEDMKVAAEKLVKEGAKAVVVTGGHLQKASDVFFDGATMEVFSGDKIRSNNTHGTGCAFSSAIASNLALGKQLKDAVMLAKAYVTKAIDKAYPIGRGTGPLNHFYRFQEVPHRPVEASVAGSEAQHKSHF